MQILSCKVIFRQWLAIAFLINRKCCIWSQLLNAARTFFERQSASCTFSGGAHQRNAVFCLPRRTPKVLLWAWLYRIANNEIANYFRKNKKYSISLDRLKEKGVEPIALRNPETEFLEAQEKLKNIKIFLKIQEKIAKLPIKYQEVITLRFFEKKN